MPKLHKMRTLADRPIKSRPIAACHSWITTFASIYLADELNALLRHYPTVLRDRNQLVRELHGLQVSPNTWLVTFDVAELYPSCPHGETMAACIAAMKQDPDFKDNPAKIQWYAKLLLFVLKNNIVSVPGDAADTKEHYRQIRGGAMGTNCMPPAAQLYLAVKWEELLKQRLGARFPSFFKRYIDDGFLLFEGTEQELLSLLRTMDTLLPNIRITYTYSQFEVEMLDLVIEKCVEDEWCSPGADGMIRLRTRTHQKPLNLYLYIPFTSHHPPGVFKSLVNAELLRYVQTCSEEHWYECMKRKLFHRLRRRGYPPAFLERIASNISYTPRRQAFLAGDTTAVTTDGPPIVLCMPYARITPQLQPQQLLHQAYTQAHADVFSTLPNRPIVAFKKTKSLIGLLVNANH